MVNRYAQLITEGDKSVEQIGSTTYRGAKVWSTDRLCKILNNKRFVVFSCSISKSKSVVKDEFLFCDGCLF